MKKIKLIILVLILFSSCSSLQERIYENKSCATLFYEKEHLDLEIKKVKKILVNVNRPIDSVVVGTGGLLSVAYLTVELTYFYVLPALTIFYHNVIAKHDKNKDKLEKMLKRQEVLRFYIKEKKCTAQ